MANQRKIEINNYYHIYSRGVNKCDIFLDHADYKRFEKYLTLCNTKLNIKFENISYIKIKEFELVHIVSYCLMPNHFHLILQEKIEGGISLFIQKILSGYTLYFNKKHERIGALFGTRFKDKIIDNDIYFKQLIFYIYNNPLKLIKNDYDSKKLIRGEIKLNQTEKIFLKTYPYKYTPSRSDLSGLT